MARERNGCRPAETPLLGAERSKQAGPPGPLRTVLALVENDVFRLGLCRVVLVLQNMGQSGIERGSGREYRDETTFRQTVRKRTCVCCNILSCGRTIRENDSPVLFRRIQRWSHSLCGHDTCKRYSIWYDVLRRERALQFRLRRRLRDCIFLRPHDEAGEGCILLPRRCGW